jgi:protein-L-isoaspartate(D-aspartate) O-methyltransferase
MLDLSLESMIREQLVSRGIDDQQVIHGFRRVSRRIFVPDYLEAQCFSEEGLPIGLGQTISPPYMVGRMLQAMQIRSDCRVLEVGTGSGFQAALLATLAKQVFTVEILPELSARARRVLCDSLRFSNVHFRVGDGFNGWSDEAPFDAVVVNASAVEPPWPLLGQLRVGGRLVMPVGLDGGQRIKVFERLEDEDDPKVTDLGCFRMHFAPLRGEALD